MAAAGARARPTTSAATARKTSPKRARRRDQATIAAKKKPHAAISQAVHGRSSTAAHGKAAARTQARSKIQSPTPARRAAAGANTGSQLSAAHSAKPPASSGPDRGINKMLTRGPTSEARPNTSIHNGQSAAVTAMLHKKMTAAARAKSGQASGTARSAALPAQRMAAHAPTLITALGDRAEAGSTMSRTAAAKVRAAAPVVSRPKARAASTAASITQDRTHGGSAPVIKV